MKKILIGFGIALALITGLTTTNAFAYDSKNADPPGRELTTALQQYFPHANNVRWEEQTNHYVARFYIADHFIQAKFDRKGNFLFSYSTCSPESLPFHILTKLAKAYPGYETKSAVEYTGNKSDYYLVWLKKDKHKQTKWIRVKVDTYEALSVVDRMQQVQEGQTAENAAGLADR